MKRILISIIFLFIEASATSQDYDRANKGNSIKLDAKGNVYTTGAFVGTVDFDPGPKEFYLNALAYRDIFISKLDGSGDFVWAKSIAGISEEAAHSITLDALGNVYTTGFFYGTTDFDPGPTTFNLTPPSKEINSDAFISKLDSLGNFVWALQLGGVLNDFGVAISVDALGNIYTTGNFAATVDFDPGPGTLDLTATSNRDIFILKLDPSGNLLWARQLGGAGFIEGHSLVVDAAGSVYTTENLAGGTALISKLDSSGNLVWSKNIVGARTYSIAFDSLSNAYTTGYFYGTPDFDPGTGLFNLTGFSAEYRDIFILKLDSTGNFVWAKQLGGAAHENAYSIAIDALRYVYTTGEFYGTADFDPGTGTFNLIPFSAGYSDIFISKLDSLGNFEWAKQLGRAGYDIGSSITLDALGGVYLTGSILTDIFVSKLDSSGNFVWQKLMYTSPTVGIDDAIDFSEVTIFPNPTKGVLNVAFSEPTNNVRIEIYSSLGRLIYNQTDLTELTTIDLTEYASGLYFVRQIKNNKSIATQRVVKY